MRGTDAASEIDGSSASPTRGASPATLAQGSRWQVGHPKCSKLVRPEEPARLQPWFVLSTWAVDHAVYSQLSDLQIRGFLASLSTFIVSFDFNSCHVALAIHAQVCRGYGCCGLPAPPLPLFTCVSNPGIAGSFKSSQRSWRLGPKVTLVPRLGLSHGWGWHQAPFAGDPTWIFVPKRSKEGTQDALTDICPTNLPVFRNPFFAQ